MKLGRARPAKSDDVSPTVADLNTISDDGSVNKEPVGKVETAPATQEEPEYVTGWKLWSALLSLSLIFVLVLLDMSIVATAIPNITSQFHSLDDVGWYGSAYLLSNCALQPLTGKIYTRYNTKWTFIVSFLIFEFGSLICGVATSSTMLIIGRAIAGMGGSGLMNGGLQIIYIAVPSHRRPAIMGILMSFSQLGLVGGPLLGGVLTQYASWRWCFYINLPVGAVALVCLVLIKIKPGIISRGEHDGTWPGRVKELLHSLDFAGFVLFAGFAVMIVLALQWGGEKYSWSSGTIIGLLVGSIALLAVFAAREYSVGPRAMFPWAIVRQLHVWTGCLTMFMFFGSQMIGNYYLPIYFQTVRGASPSRSGVYTLPSIFGTMVMSISSGILVSKWGYYLPWMMTSAVLAGIGNGLLSTLDLQTSTVKWVFFQIITGLGRGCGMQMPLVAIQVNLPPASVPIGTALIVFHQNFGGAFFLAIAQTLLNSGLGPALRQFAPNVDPQIVIHAGASGAREVVSKQDLPGVLMAFTKVIHHEFYVAAALSSGYLLTCLGMGWKKVEKKPVATTEDTTKNARLAGEVHSKRLEAGEA